MLLRIVIWQFFLEIGVKVKNFWRLRHFYLLLISIFLISVSVIDEKEDFNGSYNHEFDVKFAIDNKETKVTFKAETPEEKRSWMAVLGSDFVFYIFSQSSQIFSHKRNWHKNAKSQKLSNLQNINSWMIKII